MATDSEDDPFKTKRIWKLITWNESPEKPGITVRYAKFGDVILMLGFIFKPKKVRCGCRPLTLAEHEAYCRQQAEEFSGSYI